MAEFHNISDLLLKHLTEVLSEEEQKKLDEWLEESLTNRAFWNSINDEEQLTRLIVAYQSGERELSQARVLNKVLEEIYPAHPLEKETSPAIVVSAKRSLFSSRWWAAASVIFVVIVGGYFLLRPDRSTPAKVVALQDIPGGTSGAVLTLTDGKKIVLDSLQNGTITSQNGATVSLQNGNLTYDPSSDIDNKIALNTLSTPNGRQFQMMLADGSKVWLNAGSSITYPVAFSKAIREVTITGEVYFEIAKNALKPFIVHAGNSSVQVLGTSFNVNAYNNETAIQTTLVDGSVKLLTAKGSLTLTPGQQGELQADGRIESRTVNLPEVLAWKNGFFQLTNSSFKEIMRQIERWYDIEIEYENGVPDVTLSGKMKRDLSLSQMLDGLSELGVHFHREGRKVIVLQQ